MRTREYNFALVVDGLDVDDDRHIEAFYAHGCSDATVENRGSLALVTFYREGVEPYSVLWSAIHDVEAAVPGARVTEVDEQLVSASDIAELVDRTPESIRQLADGRRGPGGFPTHVAEIGKGVRVWRWPDVHTWLAAHGITEEATPLPREVIVEANSVLAKRQHAHAAAPLAWVTALHREAAYSTQASWFVAPRLAAPLDKVAETPAEYVIEHREKLVLGA